MPLSLKSRFCGNVHIMQCWGRIVAGDEVKSLDAALDLASREVPRIVLNVSEVDRLDSIGIGLLVRYATRLRKRGGDIRLAGPQPFIVTLLKLTMLSGILQVHPTEDEAILSFLDRPSDQNAQQKPGPRVLILDQSVDLCAFVKTVLDAAWLRCEIGELFPGRQNPVAGGPRGLHPCRSRYCPALL